MAQPVCRPMALPMPVMVMNRQRGTKPAGGGPLFLSVTAHTAMRSTNVPRNSSQKHDTFVKYGA